MRLPSPPTPLSALSAGSADGNRGNVTLREATSHNETLCYRADVNFIDLINTLNNRPQGNHAIH